MDLLCINEYMNIVYILVKISSDALMNLCMQHGQLNQSPIVQTKGLFVDFTVGNLMHSGFV